MTGQIPPAVAERGVEAFVRVLRRRHPDAVFVVREGVSSGFAVTTATRNHLLLLFFAYQSGKGGVAPPAVPQALGQTARRGQGERSSWKAKSCSRAILARTRSSPGAVLHDRGRVGESR